MNVFSQHGVTSLVALIAFSGVAIAAEPAKAPLKSGAMDTDAAISDLNALERTRPFPVGDQRAYFVNIKNGDKVRSPFRVAFAISGMGVSPVRAGAIDGTGHHHILIDKPFPTDIKAPIPFDKADEYAKQHYKHFGKGETETILNLPPGKHTLQLLFADHNHVPYYIRSGQVAIEVEEQRK